MSLQEEKTILEGLINVSDTTVSDPDLEVTLETDETATEETFFSPEVFSQLLNKYTPQQLLNLSIKELYEEYSLNNVMGGWEYETTSESSFAKTSYEFEGFAPAALFFNRISYEVHCTGVKPHSISIKEEGGKFNCSISIPLKDQDSLSKKELQFVQYCNYTYTKSKNDYDLDYYFADRHKKETYSEQEFEQSFEGEPLEIVYFTDSDGVQLLKVPVARVGEWKHPEYGKVVFSQEDFDSIVKNFSDRVLGYEPPLFLGHPIDVFSSEGYPAEGFLKELVQEGDVLFGLFEDVSHSTYTAVKERRFRYSSGEFVRNYKSKESGTDVGTILVGMALTNRPFITNLPRVSALSEQNISMDKVVKNVVLLSETTKSFIPSDIAVVETNYNSSSNKPVMEKPTEFISIEEYSEFKNNVKEEFSNLQQSYSEQTTSLKQELSELKVSYEQKLSEATQRIILLTERADAAENALKQKQIEADLKELSGLTIPDELKTKYSEKIQAGTLENKEDIFEMLRTMSNSVMGTAIKQYGANTATESLNDANLQDPYKATIERNMATVKLREQKLQQLLA